MYRQVELTIKLFRIYLHDDSEKANIGAIDALMHTFDAVSGALFYVNVDNGFRFCLSGTDFPITLPEERWRKSVQVHKADEGLFTFSNWSPPGFDRQLEFWVSAPIHTSGSEPGYVFLGKNSAPWSADEKAAILASIEVVGELIEIRHKRDLESLSRLEAENSLARTERRMATFFESSPDMIYSTDAGNRFTSINQAGLKLLGIERKEDVIGHRFSEFLKNNEDMDFFLQKIRENGLIADHEILISRKNGTEIFCLVTSHAVKGADNEIAEIQGLIKDITDRIRNERELWKMNLELSEINMKYQQAQDLMVQHEKLASIGQLAAGVAHEINNPLGFLGSNQGMLKKYFMTIRSAWAKNIQEDPVICQRISKEYDLEYIYGETEHIFKESDEGFTRIVKIVSNLMTFSRKDQNIDFEKYDVNAGIESTLSVAWNEIKYVADVTKKFGELPQIYVRSGEINQVLLNILVNAAQAVGSQKRSEKGLIAIETKLEGPFAVILIKDNGPGIPQKHLSKIFDPFFTTKEPGKGTGLGLSISYDIVVTKHKGRLSVESKEGEGATFRIELPVAPMDK